MREQKYFYRCHNCGHGTTFQNVLRNLNPSLFKEYSFERYKDKTPEKKEFVYKPQPVKQTSTMFLDMVATRISNLPANDTAVKYLADRKIPKEKWTDLFYIEDLNLLKKEFPKYEEIKFHIEPRIIIPIRNRAKNIIGINTRAIYKSKLRYINMLRTENEPLIYNLENIDLQKKIYVTEGAFDSMFLNNSIAVSGADFSKITDLIAKENTIIIFDNQPRNRELKYRMKKIAEEGWNMCVWPEDTGYKDINEMVKHGLTSEKITKIINENVYSGMRLRLALSGWFKI